MKANKNITVICFKLFWWWTKFAFWRGEKSFIPKLQITWYVLYETFLSFWMVVKVFLIWNINYNRFSFICLNSYHHPNSEKHTRNYSVACSFGIWNTNTAFTLRSWIKESYLLEEHRLFVIMVWTPKPGQTKSCLVELLKICTWDLNRISF
jgi:hypothetical protein